jgi:hypothetical protein
LSPCPIFAESSQSIKSEKSLDFLKVGDRVRIKPEWQDEGDDRLERIVIEAPENSPRGTARGFSSRP